MKNDVESMMRQLHDHLQQALAAEKALRQALLSSALPEAGKTPTPQKHEEESATALLNSVTSDAATRIEASRAKAATLLPLIQYATEEGRDSSSLEADVLLLVGDDVTPAWRERIAEAKKKGMNARRERERLAVTLQSGVCSEDMAQYWHELPNRAGWFTRKAIKQIVWQLGKEMERACKKGGLPQAEALLQQARQRYGAAVDNVSLPDICNADHSALPSLVQGTVHTLASRKAVGEWHIYIDETGVRFSEEESGTEGRVVAVCVRQGSSLPNLGRFHATDAGAATVLRHCNTLLQSDCGILGFTRSSLAIQGQEGWLQAIRELVKWVWRLLPLQANGMPVGLRFHVEQRQDYAANLATELGEKFFKAELARENPQRARQMRFLSFDFENKNAPMLAWADLLANLWSKYEGDNNSIFGKCLQNSGLLHTCLVCCPAQTLKTCDTIFTGGLPDGDAWIDLLRKKERDGSLQQQALHLLQQRCQAEPTHWETYARAMQDYLAGKQYSLEVLERMSVWLRPMKSAGLAAEYFWQMAELARMNHLGDVASADMQHTVTALRHLAPEMGKTLPEAPLHAALRLAVADTNAFEFSRAEARLAPWNPLAGGKLTGSALWDGKILSSLGQCRAFQGDPVGGTHLFLQALQQFDALETSHVKEADRQRSQTRTYLAVARMDSPGLDTHAVQESLEQALGMPVAEAAEKWGACPVEDNPYPHYLLARYLAYAGTEDERAPYKRLNMLWTKPEQGFGSGHPWPQIQYFRWLMCDDDDVKLRRALAKSLNVVRGHEGMPTVDLIVVAIALSMNFLKPDNPLVRAMLLQLGAQLTGADAIVQQLLVAEPGDKLLARRLIPFNFC